MYGRIEYFFVHNYFSKPYMLAYIQWAENVHINKYNVKTFQGFGNYDFVEVQYIDRCVGFMRIDNNFVIFDKENQIDCDFCD
jgi:hypothetical protein